MSHLVKDYDMVLDLGREAQWLESVKAMQLADAPMDQTTIRSIAARCEARRPPPLLPDEFKTILNQKQFTSKKADCENVVQIYREAFTQQLGAATELNFSRLGWTDVELIGLLKVLGDKQAPARNCTFLALKENAIGDDGIKALVRVLISEPSPLPKLTRLELNGNAIGDGGFRAIAAAYRDGSLPGTVRMFDEDNFEGGIFEGNKPASSEARLELKQAYKQVADRIPEASGPTPLSVMRRDPAQLVGKWMGYFSGRSRPSPKGASALRAPTEGRTPLAQCDPAATRASAQLVTIEGAFDA